MGNNASSSVSGITVPSATSSGYRGGFLGAFWSGRRFEFTMTNMRTLHAQLTRFAQLPDAEIVELLRVLSEFLIYSDQHRVSVELEDQVHADSDDKPDDAGVFFDYFGETNMLALLVELGASQPSVLVQVQLLQTLSILVQNITTRTSLYYILSNNHVNRLLECPFSVDRDDDVRDWYVTLLKALSLRLNEETVQFFLDTQRGEDFSFPLYARALKFRRCNEAMVKVAVKTLTLNVLKVPDARVRRFVLQYDDLNYFRDIVEIANDLTFNLQGLLNTWPSSGTLTQKTMVTEKLEEAVDAYIDHCYYLQDLLDVNVPELCYKVGEMLFSRHVKNLLATSIVPDCGPPPQRVSTQLALFLLTRLLGILEHTPLVNAIIYMLLSSDLAENCEYSVVALGAGSRPRQPSLQDSHDGDEDTVTTENSPQPLPSSLRWDDEDPPKHVFHPHSATLCESPLCYVQTRFAMGEWPVEEVKTFVFKDTNCYRQSLLALLCSSDERLASTVVMLLLAIVNNKAVDQSLLLELDLLPFRCRHRKDVDCEKQNVTIDSSVLPSTGSLSSLCDSSSSEEMRESAEKDAVETDQSDTQAFLPNEDEDKVSNVSAANKKSSWPTSEYPSWLVDLLLEILARSQSWRLLGIYLCERLLVDVAMDTRLPIVHCLTEHHTVILKNIHLSSAHLVMESIRGAMTEVDYFIYELEKEVTSFQLKSFPMELQLDSSSPYECLIPLENEETTKIPAWAGSWDTLALRLPVNEVEVCRKAMRVFLSIRKLREHLDVNYVKDGLERLVVYRHPRTNRLANAADGNGTSTAPLDGLVTLKCIYREHRFLLMPTRLLMVLNPEALVLVEKNSDQSDDSNVPGGEGKGIVKLFAPIHRTYCTLDSRDDRVLQVSVRSAIPVPGCRIALKDHQNAAKSGNLVDWNVLLMFQTAEECAQAHAHINISGIEVRAFKLHLIEKSLTTHLYMTETNSSERHGSFFIHREQENEEEENRAESSSNNAESDDDDSDIDEGEAAEKSQ